MCCLGGGEILQREAGFKPQQMQRVINSLGVGEGQAQLLLVGQSRINVESNLGECRMKQDKQIPAEVTEV